MTEEWETRQDKRFIKQLLKRALAFACVEGQKAIFSFESTTFLIRRLDIISFLFWEMLLES